MYLQEIRRHLMIKRPQFSDNEEKLADAEETRSSHKTHHHSPKGHASRHHKKHDKIAHTTADLITNTTTESVTKINTTPSDEKPSTTEDKPDKYSSIETSTTETASETSTTMILTTVKPKKQPRRQKIKETPTNRTEIEEDKPQRRRKTHHRKNNTLLTNSVHDDVPRANTTYVTSDVTLSTQNPTTREKHNHKFMTVPATTITEASTVRQGTHYSEVFRSNNDSNEDRTTESIAVTESGSTITMTSIHMTEVPKINPAIDKSFGRPRNTSIILPTTPSVKRYPKVQKNRTTGLGPARIDVTILESPDRKHKQGMNLD